MTMEKVKVGISIGDINGIGLEVIIKTLKDKRILNNSTAIIYASSKVFSYHCNNLEDCNIRYNNIKSVDEAKDGMVNVLSCWEEEVKVTLGEATKEGGKYAAISLSKATQDVIDKKIDCLVTAPINKKVMDLVDFGFIGHTEYLMSTTGANEVLMMLCSQDMRMALATGHTPIQDVNKVLDKASLVKKVELLIRTLKYDFDLDKPRIAVLGIQPHAGDGGMIGDEDETITKPAVTQLKNRGHLVYGPFPSDAFFGNYSHKKFDAIVSCYHDQGLIPFKMASFGDGVNITCGLPIIRTSPDHGTAFDIAGKDQANPSSFRQAYFLAMDAFRKRERNIDIRSNPININRRNKDGDVVIKE